MTVLGAGAVGRSTKCCDCEHERFQVLEATLELPTEDFMRARSGCFKHFCLRTFGALGTFLTTSCSDSLPVIGCLCISSVLKVMTVN
jgi:hypothetical protein